MCWLTSVAVPLRALRLATANPGVTDPDPDPDPVRDAPAPAGKDEMGKECTNAPDPCALAVGEGVGATDGPTDRLSPPGVYDARVGVADPEGHRLLVALDTIAPMPMPMPMPAPNTARGETTWGTESRGPFGGTTNRARGEPSGLDERLPIGLLGTVWDASLRRNRDASPPRPAPPAPVVPPARGV